MSSYCSMTDQADEVWYLTVDATLQHTDAILTALDTVPVGLDLTPTAPHWLQLGGDSGNRYLYLTAGGVVTVSESAPAVGSGVTRPNGLQLMDVWRYLWRVTLQPESEDAFGWVLPGWIALGWVAIGMSDYTLSLVRAGFEVHKPQGLTIQSGVGAR